LVIAICLLFIEAGLLFLLPVFSFYIDQWQPPNGMAQRQRQDERNAQPSIVFSASQARTISGEAPVRWSRCWAALFYVEGKP